MFKNTHNFEKGAIHLFALVAAVGVLGFFVATNLVDIKNSFFGQLFSLSSTNASSSAVTFVDQGDNQVSYTLTPTVRVKLTPPWPIAYQNNSLIKEAYAQSPSFLVANWRFDETATWNNNCRTLSVTDSSVNLLAGMSCANNRGPTVAVPGKVGMARDFSGNRAYVQVNDNAKLDFIANQDFSLSVWFKKSVSNQSSSFLISKGAGGTADTGYSIVLLNGQTPTLALSRPNESARFTLSGNAINDNNWHLITAVINRSGEAILYVDGAVVASSPVSSWNVNLSNSKPLTIGCYGSGTSCFTGTIDDVRVYNTALSAAEVTSIYTGVNAPPTSTPSPIATPTPSPTPLITQITISESADLTANPVIINPVTAIPTFIDYTFSDPALGTKTLYARFTSNTGQNQDDSATIQLVDTAPTPSPTPSISYDTRVTDFGAVGDGVADDTTAFMNAIAATPVGGTLFVPSPTDFYRIHGTINVNKSVRIIGEGSTLKKATTSVIFNLFTSNIIIENLRMIGPGNSGVAVYSETPNLTGIVIQNNYIEGWVDGIAFSRVAGIKILNNNIRHSQYAGIMLDAAVGTFIGAGKPTIAELRSGVDLADRFSILVDSNTIYDVKGFGGGDRNGYGITISHDGTTQPARALVVRNRVEYVNTWECYDTHAGKEMYFLDNYCYMAMRAFNLAGDRRYNVPMTDVYAVRNTIVKGPQGAVPTGIGLPGDIFSSTGGGNYDSLESIVLVDSSRSGPAAGGIYDNKLFGYGFTGWAGIDVRDLNRAPVSGNTCYESVLGDINSVSKSCP